MNVPTRLECANCRGIKDVQWVTPDMDIAPVPLCLLCRIDLNWQEKLR